MCFRSHSICAEQPIFANNLRLYISRDQLKRAAALTEEDFVQLDKCRRPHNRLGFAYQVALSGSLTVSRSSSPLSSSRNWFASALRS
jgi:hypothetical protein